MVQRIVKNPDDLALLPCQIDGCGKRVFARGWCNAHYTRWRRHGDPLSGGTSNGDPARFLRDVAFVYPGDDCLRWPFSDNGGGYGTIRIRGNMRLVSRIVCERVHGAAPTQSHEAAHSCGKGHEGCCNPKHLRWATHADNLMDRIAHGTSNAGERHGLAKLSSQAVSEIRAAAPETPLSELAHRYGVSISCVDLVRRRVTWREVAA